MYFLVLIIAALSLVPLSYANSSRADQPTDEKKIFLLGGIVQFPSSLKTTNLVARYVRITLPTEGWLNLAEVEVIGRFPGENDDRNLALDKPTRQSSTADSGKAGSWLAVDGSADGLYSNGSVSHTNLEFSPWWEVDLGAECQIREIRIFNRGDGVQDRLKDIEIALMKKAGSRPLWLQNPTCRALEDSNVKTPPRLLNSNGLRVLSWTIFAAGVLVMIRNLWRQERLRKSILWNAFLIIAAIMLAIVLKINRKFDSLSSIACTGASIALSKYNYGLKGYKAFLDYTGGPLYYGSINSAGDFSKGIRGCVKLENPWMTPPPDPQGPKMMGLYFRDNYGFMPGYSPAIADYYALAFLLFGYSWPATFWLYFFLLGFSALLYFYAFHSNPNLLALLTCTLAGYLCLVVYMFHIGLALQDTRTISCLAVLPTMHLMSFLFAGKRWSGVLAFSILAQLALLLLVVRIRHSAVWFCLALALGSIAVIGQS